jgi:hypothetical protein
MNARAMKQHRVNPALVRLIGRSFVVRRLYTCTCLQAIGHKNLVLWYNKPGEPVTSTGPGWSGNLASNKPSPFSPYTPFEIMATEEKSQF